MTAVREMKSNKKQMKQISIVDSLNAVGLPVLQSINIHRLRLDKIVKAAGVLKCTTI